MTTTHKRTMFDNIIMSLADRLRPYLKLAMDEYNLVVTYSDSCYCLLECSMNVIRILIEVDGTLTLKVNNHNHKDVKLDEISHLIITELQIP